MQKAKPSPLDWTCGDVAEWLAENDLDAYADLLANHHKVDGRVLVGLTESDLREKPLQLTVLGDIKRLSKAIKTLKCRFGIVDDEKMSNGSASPATVLSRVADSVDSTAESSEDNFRIHGTTMSRSESGSDFIIHKVESKDTKTKSFVKTALAAVYCSFVFFLTSIVMVVVHDRVPDMKTYPPLPDIVLDSIPLIPWAFEVCEMLVCALAVVWVLVLVFHKHRLVLLRRMFSLTGTVFLLRCVTMLITSLSVPGVHLECASQSYGDLYGKLRQALRIWYGMGMSLRGVRTCGDYMFSGHTTAVTLLNHFVTEYTPDDWHYMHTASWVVNLFSIFFILAGHEHYSIDVFIAFYISSRLFLYYHSMAYHARSMTSADSRTRIWFPLFWFFESGGHVGRVKNEYEIPLPSLVSVRHFIKSHLSHSSSAAEEDEVFSPHEQQKQKVKFHLGHHEHKNGANGAEKKHKGRNGKTKSS